jgi:catechol 2,3-dioxygenase-like lactoylglutathione lyase family enzyme
MSVLVPRQERDRISRFYRDVLGGEITRADPERDFIRLGEDFYIVLYGDVPDESEALRSGRFLFLELKSDDVEGMTRKVLDFGVTRLEVPDAHFYFQAPGGQCFRLVGVDEDLSFYEGAGEGSDVAKVKEALGRQATKN